MLLNIANAAPIAKVATKTEGTKNSESNFASRAVVQSRSLMDDREITAQQFLPSLVDSRQPQLFEVKIAGKGTCYCK